jgi:hypothetical protein
MASAGSAMQLVGLSWDSIQHHLDPSLVEREDVFSLANPSHLLLMLGLGLTVFGLVAVLIVGNERRAGSIGRRFRRNLAGVTLTVLFGTTSIVGLATGGIDGRHEHVASALGSSAAGGSNVTSTPTFNELQGVLRSSGTSAALDRLEAMANKDQKILSVAHDYAHAIGKLSLQLSNNPQGAFESCRETFQSGCYHGVIEGYLQTNPRLTGTEIANLCDGTFAPNTAAVVRFQCLHGLGHGLTANYEHDIFKALRMCDALDSDWDRGSCYGGVFMENIIFFGQLQEAANGTGPQHDHGGAGHKAYLEANDPLYPCNVVDERYKSECFVMQTSPILMFNGFDFPKALQECDRAQRDYIQLCYQSLGRDISSYTYRNPARATQMCLGGQAAYRGYCFVGVAKNMIDVTWKIDEALDLCARAPGDDKGACYNAIGEQLANIYPDLSSRERECARSEPAFVAACARGAVL